MMPSAIQEKDQSPLPNTLSLPVIHPSTLLIGKKRALDYLTPALFRLNNNGELVIKATGSLSIVTAVNVAEMIKRDVKGLVTKSVTIGTDELVIASGERKRMSCIEIHLIKIHPLSSAKEPTVNNIFDSNSVTEGSTTLEKIKTYPTVAIEEKNAVKNLQVRKKVPTTSKSVGKKTIRSRKKKSSV
jgi:DNA-binding protein Alba